MPKETFFPTGVYPTTKQEYEEQSCLTVSWGKERPFVVVVNGADIEWQGVNRMIAVLKKARDQAFGTPE